MSFQDVESNGNGLQLHAPRRQSTALSSGVFQIITKVSTFKKLINNLGTPKDTVETRQELKRLSQQITNMVKETKAALKETSKIDHSIPGDASKKYEDAKLAKQFEDVLQDYQAAQRKAAQREAAYTPFVPSRYTNGDVDFNSQTSQGDLAMQRRQEMLRLESEVVFNDAIIEEREEGIREIANQIGEVHEIMTDLAVLVRDQGHTIVQVEDNVEGSEFNTRRAREQLIRAEASQKSSTSLTCLLLALFGLLVLVLFIVFVA